MSAAALPFSPANFMALPETIPVRRTEEEAGYVSFRPVVRQNFSLNDLLGMVLGVTGKNLARIQKILRSGSVSFHLYRYSWQGFEIEEHELESLLSRFPDADALRPFSPDNCVAVLFEARAAHSHSRGSEVHPVLELDRAAASRRPLLRLGRHTLWDALMAAASAGSLAYEGYSYSRRADLYALDLSPEQAASLAAAAQSLAPRDMHRNLRAIESAARVVYVCPRESH
jgi:hypothetical protein